MERSPVILFDGECNLCSAWVRFIIKRDPAGRLRFASLQSPAAEILLRRHCILPGAMGTIVLVDGDRCFTRSDALIEITRELSAPWPLFTILKLVPRFLRDACYDLLARNRYRWFGKLASCMVPTAEIRSRFLD